LVLGFLQDVSWTAPKKYAPNRGSAAGASPTCHLYSTFSPKIKALGRRKTAILVVNTKISSIRLRRLPRLRHKRQSPVPGSDEKYFSYLLGTPSNSLASAGGSFLVVMLGQVFANSAFRFSHFSRPGSVSGLIASTGHSGSHTPQSMHSSGWMT